VPVPDPASVVRLWPAAEELGVAIGVTTRHGGVSRPPYDSLNLGLHVGDRPEDVAANRARAAAAFGVPLTSLVFAEQVHSTTATLVTKGDAGRGVRVLDDAVPATDAVVTTSPAVTLVILVADCVPIALVDPAAHVLAAVHAGWRGTAAGVVTAALRAMAEQGAQPARVRAFLGPAVAPDRYEVGPEVVDALARAVGPTRLDDAVVRSDTGPAAAGRACVDLVAANRQQLLAGGLRPEHVLDSGTTTADPSYFSDRAARPCGRFGLLARWVG
jgi:YfiH family protein